LRLRLQKYSFLFTRQVLNSELSLKQEIKSILLISSIKISRLSRPKFKSAIQIPNYVLGSDILTIRLDEMVE